jgi:hypothetical protein
MRLSGWGFWTVEEFAGDALLLAAGLVSVGHALGGGTYGT